MFNLGNLFEWESKWLLTIDIKFVTYEQSEELLWCHCENGQQHFKEFIDNMVSENISKLYDPIKNNKLDIFNSRP